jgi:hypothetical protein
MLDWGCSAHQGDKHVHRERQCAETNDFNFNFQVANQGARHACRVKVRASCETEAATYFRDNLPMIEALARKNLSTTRVRPRLIRLQAG